MSKNLFFGLILFIALSLHVKAQLINDTLTWAPRTYNLGEVEITARSGKHEINLSKPQQVPWQKVNQTLHSLPFIVNTFSGARNEAGLNLRGNDIRSVPVFIDGIPVYIPYDGNFDLARLNLADLSKIDVSAGNASLLYGPNTQGGAINLVSYKPVKETEALVKSSLMSGEGYSLSARIGHKAEKYWVSGHIINTHRDYFPLSHHFDTTGTGEKDFHRSNSFMQDFRTGLRIGFTPRTTDEYSLSYSYQHSSKGNPVYLGKDPKIPVRYWQWPKWDKQNLYFLSGTQLPGKVFLKTRLYYDKFDNQLNSYDDDTYSSQSAKYAFTSYYNDDTYGGSAEANWSINPANHLRMAVLFKRDNHRENNEGEPVRHASDNIYSIALEDEYWLGRRASIIPSLSYNRMESVKAEDYNSKTGLISVFPQNNHEAFNGQLIFNYRLLSFCDVRLSAAHKTRFPTMKDRYSYRLGKAKPNPFLDPEQSQHYEMHTDMQILKKLSLSGSVFHARRSKTIQIVDNVEPGISQVQNTGVSHILGVDLMLDYQPLEDLQLSAGYSWLHQKNLSHPELKFVNAPKHKVFAELKLKPFQESLWVLNSEYNSESNSTSYGSTSPGFLILNTWLSFSISRHFTLQGGINNLLDKSYFRTEGYPEEGRNFFISLIVNHPI
ncbi:MAG: TonB-dependent receptor plug domain-containing protein [Bacteroidales bacterium]